MSESQKKYLIVIAGPTASGKTDIAIQLAKHFQTDIISADARQFYRELNAGTAKPTPEQLESVTQHFINHLSIHDQYDVGKYESDVIELLEQLFTEKNIVILCGGSGLFIKAITDGLDKLPATDPEIRKQLQEALKEKGIGYLQQLLKVKDPTYYISVDRNNPHRLIRALEVCLSTGETFSSFHKHEPAKRNFESIKIYLELCLDELYLKINQRVDSMFQNGLEEEAKELFPYRQLNALQTVGYSELFEYFENSTTIEEAKEFIKQHSRNYAKRQITWFKKDKEFIWMKPDDYDAIVRMIESRIKSRELRSKI